MTGSRRPGSFPISDWECIGSFIENKNKKYKRNTAKEIIKLLQKHSAKTILDQFVFYKKSHKKNTIYQIWEEGCAPKLISGYEMMRNKIEYIHHNPVKRGFVDMPEHWRYSSARNYMGNKGLIEVDMDWS